MSHGTACSLLRAEPELERSMLTPSAHRGAERREEEERRCLTCRLGRIMTG